jgi:predicted nucleotidyltransferase
MSKIPDEPKDIFAAITDDYKQLFGHDLVSIILYGSAARDEYTPGKSDINFIIVLSERGIESLEQTFKVIARWKKRNVATPLFLTEDYVRTSLDGFPIEYLNFQNAYELVYGKDILKDLTFDPRFLRLQCEREIKGKLLLLRAAFLETQGKGRHLQQLVAQSVRAFIAIFCGLLYLEGKELPRDSREVVRQVCETFELDSALFEKLLDIRGKNMKPGAAEMTGLFQAYLKEIQRLWKRVDRLGRDVEG